MRALRLSLVAAATLALGGCGLIGGIFKAGIWLGVLIVLAVFVAMVMLVAKSR